MQISFGHGRQVAIVFHGEIVDRVHVHNVLLANSALGHYYWYGAPEASGRMWNSWRTGLLAATNVVFVANLLAYLVQLYHLYSTQGQFPAEVHGYIDEAAYVSIQTTAIWEAWLRIAKLGFNSLMVNFIIISDLLAHSWYWIVERYSSAGMQSGLFHASWSVVVMIAYEYSDIMLFSTWLLNIKDSGLEDLVTTSSKGHLWSVLMLSVGAVVWFISGFLAAIMKPRIQSMIFPLVTLCLVIQGYYDLTMEPLLILTDSVSLQNSLRLEVAKVVRDDLFDLDHVRFCNGHVGSGQTMLEKGRIIVLSGPSQDALTPAEWAALVANELGHRKYKHSLTRLLMRFSARLLWMPLSLWMLSDPSFFVAFGMDPGVQPIVFGFAVTEIFAAQFDKLMFWIKALVFREMENRADQFALRIVSEKVYQSAMIRMALANQQPINGLWLYEFQFCPSRSPMSRKLRQSRFTNADFAGGRSRFPRQCSESA